MIRRLAILFLLSAIFVGCSHGSLVHDKPTSATLNSSMTVHWASDIRRVARDGDWILSRSYSKVGDAIVGATRGEDFSHAVIYDAKRDTVIEAIRPVVREVPLEDFIARNRHVVVIRPTDQNAAQGRLAIDRARTVIGASFDYSGLIGLGLDSRFYCSELVAWASQVPNPPRIVTPAELWDMGELVYMSGGREEGQVQAAARAHVARQESSL